MASEPGEQPGFRCNDYISAYGKGWALYAEKLGENAIWRKDRTLTGLKHL